jgi:hypothetical protein
MVALDSFQCLANYLCSSIAKIAEALKILDSLASEFPAILRYHHDAAFLVWRKQQATA